MAVEVPNTRVRTVPLIRELCAALERESIDYCHWKSNAFLDRSRSGENDLDLLVRRSDADRFAAVLHELRFKAAESATRALPGVSHLYGYDETAARLVHVHAHYQLILGDDLTKGYRLPLEDILLAAAIDDGEFRIAPPELELIVLVLRLALKHSASRALRGRTAALPETAGEEIRFLRSRADDELLHALLERHLPFVRQEAFDEHLRAIEDAAETKLRVASGRRLVRDLAPCARRSRAADVGLKARRRAGSHVARATGRRAPRKRLVAGGALIAIVGADGAGKSTAVEGLFAWLARDLSVTAVHLGRPPPSLLARSVGLLALARSGVRRLRRGDRGRRPSQTSLIRMLSAVALARDRYTAYRRARRAATNGDIVIADRFPLPQLTSMDAPRLRPHAAQAGRDRLTRALAALERRYYTAISPPDLLIVLRLHPERAVERKPEEPPDFVRARWRDIWDADWTATGAHLVEADRPAKSVLADLKKIVWAHV